MTKPCEKYKNDKNENMTKFKIMNYELILYIVIVYML